MILCLYLSEIDVVHTIAMSGHVAGTESVSYMDLNEDRECELWLIRYGFVYVGHDEAEKLWVKALGKLLKKPLMVKRLDALVCPFCDACTVGWTIHDVIDHAANMRISSVLSLDKQAEHRALEDYLRHHCNFVAWRAIADVSM